MIGPAEALLALPIDYRPSLQTLHLALYGPATVAALLAAVWIRRTRRTRGGLLFSVTLALLALRLGSDLLHVLSGELWSLHLLLLGLNPVLELCVLAGFVRFAGRYASVRPLTDERVTRGAVALVALAAVAVFSDPLHGLTFDAVRAHATPFAYVGADRGPIALAVLVLEGLLLLVGAGLLAQAFTSGHRPARWPAAVLSVAVAQAVLVGGFAIQTDAALTGLDYTAVALAGFLFPTTLALSDHGLRRIEAVAHREVLAELDDAVVFLDPDGAPTDCNAAARDLFGPLPADEPFLDRFDGGDAVALSAESTRAEVTLPAAAPAEETAAAEETGERTYLVHATPVRSESGRLLGHALRFADVTELKRRTRELRRKNEQIDAFASTVSHDLRNPLTVASGFLEVAAAAGTPDDPAEVDLAAAAEHLEKVGASLDRMRDIVADIEALVASADPEMDVEPVAFEAVAAAAWEAVATADATLSVDGTGRIRADESRLQRLLENLFRNSIEHAGDGVTVTVGRSDEGFFVSDDGPGIPPDARESVFEHGFTTEDDGTGLGLSIVRRLAEAHGWTVSLDPDHDGTRIVVRGCEAPPPSGSPPPASADG